jgi:hypothetical protein
MATQTGGILTADAFSYGEGGDDLHAARSVSRGDIAVTGIDLPDGVILPDQASANPLDVEAYPEGDGEVSTLLYRNSLDREAEPMGHFF